MYARSSPPTCCVDRRHDLGARAIDDRLQLRARADRASRVSVKMSIRCSTCIRISSASTSQRAHSSALAGGASAGRSGARLRPLSTAARAATAPARATVVDAHGVATDGASTGAATSDGAAAGGRVPTAASATAAGIADAGMRRARGAAAATVRARSTPAGRRARNPAPVADDTSVRRGRGAASRTTRRCPPAARRSTRFRSPRPPR